MFNIFNTNNFDRDIGVLWLTQRGNFDWFFEA